MLSYQYVEDYIEVLAGYEPNTVNLFMSPKQNISLARYDVQIVESMAVTTLYNSTALTDKQGELAVKLVLKYRKQFAKMGVDVTPVENPVWRIPLRKIDRTKSIWLEDGIIKIKFPYNQEHINQIREFKDSAMGSGTWNNDEKIWLFGLTEYNVNWLVSWGTLNSFTIDIELSKLFDRILVCEQTPYTIELVGTPEGLEITNAAPRLIEYINERLGGLTWDNLVKLVDHAGVLGYAISTDILEYCSKEYGYALEYVGTRHNVHIQPLSDPTMWDWLLDYAELTNRYPICIYDPGMIGVDLSRFNETDIVRFDRNGKTATSEYNPYDVKVVYANRIPTSWTFPVPLLISTMNMMHGGKRMEWLNKAEKIVYWTNTILNEKN